jgi:hypothetical protein
MNNTNPLTEIALIVISVALIAAATALFILGKIDYTGCVTILGMALALWGANSLYKAPSPTQQSQINTQQQSLQGVISQLMNVLPALFQVHSHPVPTAPMPVTVQPAPIAPLPMPVAAPQQANTGYVDPLATPITAQIPIAQVPFPGQVMTPQP